MDQTADRALQLAGSLERLGIPEPIHTSYGLHHLLEADSSGRLRPWYLGSLQVDPSLAADTGRCLLAGLGGAWVLVEPETGSNHGPLAPWLREDRVHELGRVTSRVPLPLRGAAPSLAVHLDPDPESSQACAAIRVKARDRSR